MMDIPVVVGYIDETVVGHLHIDESLLRGDQLKEMDVSWGYNSREQRVVQMSLLPSLATEPE